MGGRNLSAVNNPIRLIRTAIEKNKIVFKLLILKTRICASLVFRMKFRTLFMSGEEKNTHHSDLPLLFNMSKQFLAPGGLSAGCVQVSVL